MLIGSHGAPPAPPAPLEELADELLEPELEPELEFEDEAVGHPLHGPHAPGASQTCVLQSAFGQMHGASSPGAHGCGPAPPAPDELLEDDVVNCAGSEQAKNANGIDNPIRTA